MADILIVDDRTDGLLALETVLHGIGNIVQARSGEEALLRVLEHDFAVILLDVVMPGMDGHETASLIRQRERSKDTPIIFLTGTTKTYKQLFEGYQHGAVDYIFKPFMPEVLKAKVSVFVALFEKEQAFRRQAEELARANEELRRFAYVASHDLKEPLRKIGAFAQLVQTKYDAGLDEDGKRYLGLVIDGAKRMGELISDVLQYSRAGQIDPETIDLDRVLDKALGDLDLAVTDSKAVIEREDLPVLDVDVGRMTQVFENLLQNAIKFRAKDRPLRIRVAAREESGGWVVSVEDNGIGVDPRHHRRVFEMFERLHAASEYPGTGIGLAICKKVVEAHGGRIWLESRMGEGATFRISLPKRVPAHAV